MRRDSTGHASKHYTKRVELTIQQLKETLLIDAKVNTILDLHVTTTRKHDSQISPSLVKRNPECIECYLEIWVATNAVFEFLANDRHRTDAREICNHP